MWCYIISTLSVFLTTTFAYTRAVLPWQEKREDLVEVSDRVVSFLPRYNVNYPIHTAQILSFGLFIQQMFSGQIDVYRLLWMYSICIWLRSFSLYSIGLKAMKDIVQITDPLCESLIGGNVLENDLFFSGHTSTLVILAYCNPSYAWFHWLAAFVTGLSLMIGRIHYTIDVFVAPFIINGISTWFMPYILPNFFTFPVTVSILYFSALVLLVIFCKGDERGNITWILY